MGINVRPALGADQYSLEPRLSQPEDGAKENSLSSVNLPSACHCFHIIRPREPSRSNPIAPASEALMHRTPRSPVIKHSGGGRVPHIHIRG